LTLPPLFPIIMPRNGVVFFIMKPLQDNAFHFLYHGNEEKGKS